MRELRVGDEVETIGPNGVGRTVGTVDRLERFGVWVKFGPEKRLRCREECTLLGEPNDDV